MIAKVRFFFKSHMFFYIIFFDYEKNNIFI